MCITESLVVTAEQHNLSTNSNSIKNKFKKKALKKKKITVMSPKVGVATGVQAAENKMVWRKACRVGIEGQEYMARTESVEKGAGGKQPRGR